MDTVAAPERVPEVSIILPTYNRASFLPQAFAAIRAQTFTDWELIVVDDGSSDGTAEVVEALAGDCPQPVRFVYQNNQGPAQARNAGIRLARGVNVAFYDSDDVWLPHHLSDCVAALNENPDIDWVYGSSRIVEQACGKVVSENAFYANRQPRPFRRLRTRGCGQLHVLEDTGTVACAIRWGLYAGLQASVLRRSVFEELRIPSFRIGEDRLFSIHALLAGRKLAYFDNVHLIYTLHDSNSSAPGPQSLDKHVRVMLALTEAYESLLGEPKLNRPQRRALQERLGQEYFWHLGYVLLRHPGREAEALAYLRRGLGHWPWSPSWWKTYLVAWLRVATGLRSKAHPQPVRSA